MRLDIVVPNVSIDEDSDQMVCVSHNGTSIYWNMVSRTINNSKEEEMGSNIFEPLNKYLESLDSVKQDTLFNYYVAARNVFENLISSGMDDVESLARKLRPILSSMFNLFPEHEVYEWTWKSFVPGFPVDVRDAFTSDMPGTPERTYLISDYQRLIPVAIISRLAFPIITEYIHTARDDLGKLFKESSAFTLFYDSWIYKSEAMRRLYVFVDHTVGNDKHNDNAIMSGIGAEKFVEWVLAFLIIRRLMKAGVRGNSTPSVISSLYHGIDTRVRQIMTGGRNIKIKRYIETNGAEQDNLSILECFRTKEEITTGDLAIFREYIKRQIDIALDVKTKAPEHSLISRIDPTLPKQLIVDCYEVHKNRKNYEFKPIQIIMVMWVVSDYISPMVAPHLNRGNVIALISIVQAYFIHRKMYDFAILVGASYRMNINDFDRTISEGAASIPKNVMLKFQEIFPYLKRGGFEGGNSRQQVLLPSLTIDEYVRTLKSYEITPNLPRSAFEMLGLQILPTVYNTPKTIRIKIAELLMEIAERPKKQINWDTLQVSDGFDASKASF